MDSRSLLALAILILAGCGAQNVAEVDVPGSSGNAAAPVADHATAPPKIQASAATEDAVPSQSSEAQQSSETSVDDASAGNQFLLFAESIPDPQAEPAFGLTISHLQWWLTDPQGKHLRKFNWQNAEERVRPICQTVTLSRDAASIHLLGPEGTAVALSLAEGPLAEAHIHDEGQRTTFAFAPDGKRLVFANSEGRICSIDMQAQTLTKSDLQGVNQADGVLYDHTGSKIAYSKYSRKDDYSPGYHNVYVADADFTNERKLTQFEDMKQLGFGFLPDGRIGVVSPQALNAFSLTTSESEVVASWETAIQGRQFCGFSPDGRTFIYDVGGPYVLKMLSFDLDTKQVTTIRPEYLESFQPGVWVQIEKHP